jgi:hypothetical protein
MSFFKTNMVQLGILQTSRTPDEAMAKMGQSRVNYGHRPLERCIEEKPDVADVTGIRWCQDYFRNSPNLNLSKKEVQDAIALEPQRLDTSVPNGSTRLRTLFSNGMITMKKLEDVRRRSCSDTTSEADHESDGGGGELPDESAAGGGSGGGEDCRAAAEESARAPPRPAPPPAAAGGGRGAVFSQQSPAAGGGGGGAVFSPLRAAAGGGVVFSAPSAAAAGPPAVPTSLSPEYSSQQGSQPKLPRASPPPRRRPADGRPMEAVHGSQATLQAVVSSPPAEAVEHAALPQADTARLPAAAQRPPSNVLAQQPEAMGEPTVAVLKCSPVQVCQLRRVLAARPPRPPGAAAASPHSTMGSSRGRLPLLAPRGAPLAAMVSRRRLHPCMADPSA